VGERGTLDAYLAGCMDVHGGQLLPDDVSGRLGPFRRWGQRLLLIRHGAGGLGPAQREGEERTRAESALKTQRACGWSYARA
jgi:hypothetical protein